jgi:hypothetical protein
LEYVDRRKQDLTGRADAGRTVHDSAHSFSRRTADVDGAAEPGLRSAGAAAHVPDAWVRSRRPPRRIIPSICGRAQNAKRIWAWTERGGWPRATSSEWPGCLSPPRPRCRSPWPPGAGCRP